MADHLFTPEALQAIVSKIPADTTDGKTHAIIGTVDSTGAQVAVVMKLSDTWQVQGVFEHDWSGDNSGAAKIIGRW